jgi:hypothetical protein
MARIGRFRFAALVGLALIGLPVKADAAIIYVDSTALGSNNGTSWSNAYTSLVTAISAAADGDHLWVAEGEYKPGTARADSFDLPSGVKIYGGFDGDETVLGERPVVKYGNSATTLSGDGANPSISTDNAYHVVRTEPNVEEGELNGFIIRGGSYIEGSEEDDPLYRRGAGMLMMNGVYGVTDCLFEDNTAIAGGGLYVDAVDSVGAIMLTRCAFLRNTAEAGEEEGTGDGGAIFTKAEEFVFLLGKIEVSEATNFGGGLATDIAAQSDENSTILRNVLFLTNLAEEYYGGAIYLRGGDKMSLQLTNCTLKENTADADDSGAGLYCNGNAEVVTIKNSILWDNYYGTSQIDYADQIAGCDESITYSVVRGLTTGTGNFSADPSFTSTGRIQTGSPCRDAGNNTGVTWSEDIDGLPRIIGTTVDIGVNELLCIQYCPCYGDADCDGDVDTDDRDFVSANYGCNTADITNCACMHSDIDGNGIVNPADRGLISTMLGSCLTNPPA